MFLQLKDTARIKVSEKLGKVETGALHPSYMTVHLTQKKEENRVRKRDRQTDRQTGKQRKRE